MQIHVDPLGGWSGDMFVAAILDAFPDLWPVVQDAIAGLGFGAEAACMLTPHRDQALTGRRFVVAADNGKPDRSARPHDHAHVHGEHDHSHGHEHGDNVHPDTSPHDHGIANEHRSWSAIRDHLQASTLAEPVKRHAIAMFTLLAEAEGTVHGMAPDAVTFHEVGAVDSIVDIVAAAVLIDRLDAGRWTSAPLPLGSGRVTTAHGILPVPAPATALLLRGLPTLDDGIAGERVTPTGAAVARYLLTGQPTGPQAPRRLVASGTGFGSRTLPGLSNCLRVLAFDETTAATVPARSAPYGHRQLAVITFEVDDQSAEDLTHGLDHIRAREGVHDVIQSVAFGKKGRMATQVQVLVAPDRLEPTIAACFEETTTIGLRHHLVQGAALPRSFDQVEIEDHTLRIKTVVRPDGTRTGKTEAADVAAQPGHAKRLRLRRRGEDTALQRLRGTDDGGKA